jgi:DNA-binding LacI/PurR family transcriptional regulator/signal transduction histidine kinase
MRSKQGQTAARTPIIGFLAARFDEPYQHAVWSGALAEAERLGAALVFFGGQRIRSPIGYEALDNIAYDLAGRGELSGLVVMSNVIGTYISDEEQLDFLQRLKVPELVTVGIDFPGFDGVRIEPSGGMSALAEHLVLKHGRRRFVFLAGPEGHRESEARKTEFLRAVERLLPGAEPVACLKGNFAEDEAYESLVAHLDAGGKPDAVVAANDHMALGAIRALRERGFDLPREASVTGYDDTEDSRFSTPSLTTIRQPAEELGRLAIRRLAARLGLVEGGPQYCPPASFVLRESCGCEYAEGRGASRPIDEGECRYLASQRLVAEKRAAVLGEIEASLLSSFSVEEILREIARGTRELGVSGCWLCLFEAGGASPEWSKLLLRADGKGERILAPHGMRFRTAELVPGGIQGNPAGYVCVPLRFCEDRLGYLICTADSRDRRMYEALRDQVSAAMKGAKLMAAERDRERELERKVRQRTLELSAANERLLDEAARRRKLEGELLEVSNLIMGNIGRDIHDNLCQDIAGLGIMAAVLESRLARGGLPAEAGAAAAISREAGNTAAKAKAMARGLYPAELEARGIIAAVESLVATARERSGAEVLLEVTEGFAIRDSEKALHLYRIVQEALGNAVRHARAGRIRVGLSLDREAVSVEVEDDGVGIGASSGEEGGMGLHILKYRASVIGGELRIRSTERGTAVSCRVAR